MIILESKIDLNKKFDIFNEMFFDNSLPKIPITYVKLKKAAGSYHFWQNKPTTESYINIDPTYEEKGELWIEGILIHEMIHHYVATNFPGEKQVHGAKFRRMVDKINEKTHNKYRVSYTELSTLVGEEVETEKLYLLIGTYKGFSKQDIQIKIQIFSTYNEKQFLDRMTLLNWFSIRDIKEVFVVEIEVNNNFISKNDLEPIIDKPRPVPGKDFSYKSKIDDWLLTRVKQSKAYKIVSRFNWTANKFVKK